MLSWSTEKRLNFYLILLLTLMLAVTARFLLDNFISDSASARPARDFMAFWATSKLTLSGQAAAAYNIESILSIIRSTVGYEERLPWLYPPTMQILIVPLALLPYKISYGLFTLSGCAIYIYGCSKIAMANKTIILGAISFPAVYLCII